jgi:large subunit ribosomal protein L30
MLHLRGKTLKLTLVRSPIGYQKDQRATARGLGLRKINASVVVTLTPAIHGMVAKIIHLLEIEEVNESEAKKP